jgi:hypothetical protein
MEHIKPFDSVAAIHICIEQLVNHEQLDCMNDAIKIKYSVVFSPIPHIDDLPTNVYCRIQLKDVSKTFAMCSYSMPHKYKEVWATLIQQHLDARRIRPSNSAHASPAFIIPKADATVLPRWVNDYRALNSNTITDAHPLPQIDNILMDCAKGKIWSKLNMTNLFFQMRVHPDDVHLMAVMTPLGLYEWEAMPMGYKNVLAIHQRRMTAALQKYLGKFCHIYLDDIVIWSNDVAEHIRHIDLVMKALKEAKLYCNPDKCKFYLHELKFLGHLISTWGIEPDSSKADRILNWLIPKNTKDVQSFLGLI